MRVKLPNAQVTASRLSILLDLSPSLRAVPEAAARRRSRPLMALAPMTTRECNVLETHATQTSVATASATVVTSQGSAHAQTTPKNAASAEVRAVSTVTTLAILMTPLMTLPMTPPTNPAMNPAMTPATTTEETNTAMTPAMTSEETNTVMTPVMTARYTTRRGLPTDVTAVIATNPTNLMTTNASNMAHGPREKRMTKKRMPKKRMPKKKRLKLKQLQQLLKTRIEVPLINKSN